MYGGSFVMSKRVVAFLLALMCVSNMGAARDVEFNVDFFFGWDAYYRPMQWTPVEIGITSDLTEAFSGRFTISAAQDGLNTLNINRSFVLTPDLRQSFPLVTKLAFGAGRCALTIHDERGRRWWDHTINMWDFAVQNSILKVVQETDFLIGTVGQPQFGLSRLPKETICLSNRGEGQVLWGNKLARATPWDWTGFVSLDVLVLYDPDWAELRNEQLNAISQWVSNGGTVFLILGRHPLPADSPLAQVIPFHVGEPREVQVPSEALGQWGLDPDLTETVTAWPMFSKAGSLLTREVKMSQGGYLYGVGPVGFGRVAVLSFDPAQFSQEQKTRAATFWTYHLMASLGSTSTSTGGQASPQDLADDRSAGIERTIVVADTSAEAAEDPDRRWQRNNRGRQYEIGIAENAGNSVMEHLYQLKQMEPLSIWCVILTLTALALLLGPIDYLVLKRLDRLPYTWLTSTGWIVLFTVGAYWGVQKLRGGSMQLRAISVVDSLADSNCVWTTHYMGLFSPRSTDYRLTGLGPDQWWSGIAPTQDLIWMHEREVATRQISCVQADGASVPVSVPINIWTVQTLMSEVPLDAAPFTASVDRKEDRLLVEIANLSDYPIQTGYVMLEDAWAQISSVPAGAKRLLELRAVPFDPWGGSYMRGARGSARRSVPIAAPSYPSALQTVAEKAVLAQGCLDRTMAMYEYLHRGGALVCAEYVDVPPPFGVKDRSYDVNHVQLARQIVFPKDVSEEPGND